MLNKKSSRTIISFVMLAALTVSLSACSPKKDESASKNRQAQAPEVQPLPELEQNIIYRRNDPDRGTTAMKVKFRESANPLETLSKEQEKKLPPPKD